MNIYITLDYELFFGNDSGDVDNCIIKPTNDLLKITNPLGVKIVFFVDVGYIVKLNEYRHNFKELEMAYKKIVGQIRNLSNDGHGIELHVHPHWENTIYDGQKWVFDTSQYKLKDFQEKQAYDIFLKYRDFLEKISGKPPVAFRAGGWSIQPFSHIKKAMVDSKIKIDSTVFANGQHKSKNQFYDFENVNQFKTHYRFEDDVTLENPDGQFVEIPISSYRVSPLFFWKFTMVKLIKSKKHIAYGNGSAISKSKEQVIRMLTKSSNSVVSIDGYKASFLKKAYLLFKKKCDVNCNFVIIGHPKAFTPYSLKKTKQFLESIMNDKKIDFKIFE